MKYLLAKNGMEIGVALATFLLARWLLEISTPEKDLLVLQRYYTQVAGMNLSWYRGMEMYHQVRGYFLLRRLVRM